MPVNISKPENIFLSLKFVSKLSEGLKIKLTNVIKKEINYSNLLTKVNIQQKEKQLNKY